MKLKPIAKLILAGSAALALAACATSSNQPQAGSANMSDSTQASGLGGKYGYNDNILIHTSTTQAPAKQSYYFDFDQAKVHSVDVASVKAQANYLAQHINAHVRLEGNTDSRGSREYNVALGERRAKSVEHMLEMYGAKSNQISTVSYGEERPVATGNSARDFALNRRVDLVYERTK